MVYKAEIVGDIQLCTRRSLQTSNHIKKSRLDQRLSTKNIRCSANITILLYQKCSGTSRKINKMVFFLGLVMNINKSAKKIIKRGVHEKKRYKVHSL